MGQSNLDRPAYIDNLIFDWELFDVVLGGVSAMDSDFFINTGLASDTTDRFLQGYGLTIKNPVAMAELFGSYQESLQFVKRYFLKEGNPMGLDLKVPVELYSVTDLSEIFLMATRSGGDTSEEVRLWAETSTLSNARTMTFEFNITQR